MRCKALVCEVRSFLFSRYTTILHYSASQLPRAESKLDLTTVRVSTTHFWAYWPLNLEKRRLYWGMNIPLGVADIVIVYLIDIDELVYSLSRQIRRLGKR